MDIIFSWSLLSAVVASAAKSRGRSSFGWLLLSIVVSPLLASLLVLALPRLNGRPVDEKPAYQRPVNGRPINERPRQSPRPLSTKRPAFEPDGVCAGIPYKVSDTGAVEVMLSGGCVRFRSMEQFLALAIKDEATPSASPEHQARQASGRSVTSIAHRPRSNLLPAPNTANPPVTRRNASPTS